MVTEADRRVVSDLPIPPGELLGEELDARGMSQKELAVRTGRPVQAISEIVNGKKTITHETALELERVLGIPADFWVNSEASYQLARARLREREELEQQEAWLKRFPLKQLRARGHIPRERDRRKTVAALLRFFGVASFEALYKYEAAALSYRITPGSRVSPEALWSWLREGELKAAEVDAAPYDEARFRDTLLEIRHLTAVPNILAEVRDMCAAAGVIFVVVQGYPKSGASGVTRWLQSNKAMMQLSTKWSYTDYFWFAFFHEARHVLDGSKRRTYVDWADGVQNEEEAAADRFAQDTLIPRSKWRRFIATQPRSYSAVQAFAALLDIDPAIVVGRLQREKHIPYQNLNSMRSKFVWKAVDP